MSYWKLKVASGMGVNNNAASATNLWANLAGIINGTITATAGTPDNLILLVLLLVQEFILLRLRGLLLIVIFSIGMEELI